MGDLLAIAGSATQVLTGPRRHILTFHDPVPPKSDYRPPLPAEIAPGNPVRLALHIGPPPNDGGSCCLRVGLADSTGFEKAELDATVNTTACLALEDAPTPTERKPARHGGYLHPDAVAPRLLRFEVPGNALRRGYNEIALVLDGGQAQRVIWLELRIVPQ